MNYTKQDKRDYASWLTIQLQNEAKKPETVFTNYNSHNLFKDLTDVNKTINK